MKKLIGIYKITSPSGQVYVGKAVDIKKRHKQYLNLDCKKQPGIYNSLIKHGAINHKFEILEECLREEMVEREGYWQEYFDCVKNGLNCVKVTTENSSSYVCQETKDKIGKANKGKPGLIGNKNPMFGKFGIEHPVYGTKWTQSRRERMTGENNPNFGKGLFGADNPNFGKPASESALNNLKILHEKQVAENHPCSKIVLDTISGIFYYCIREAAEAFNINYKYLKCMLNPKSKSRNKTNLIVV